MKINTILAAIGMVAASIGIAGSADAQRRDHDRDRGRYEQRDHRDHRGPHAMRHDRGPRFERDRHQRCRTVIRHHRRVRVCR